MDKQIIMITEAESEDLRRAINALDRDQAQVVAAALPLDILYDAFSDKISMLADFVGEFDKLRSNRIFKEMGL